MTPTSPTARLKSIQERAPNALVIAVSKKQPIQAIEELYQAGHRDFGENYVQELVEKAKILADSGYVDIRWHFIGHLQTNKVKALIPIVCAIHSVDSERLAQEISKQWTAQGRKNPLPLFIEVNIDQEPQKAGIHPAQTPEFAQKIAGLPGISLQGLMCIPALENPGPQNAFTRLRELEAQCRPATRGQLSMGMTQDFEEALKQGATHLRIGTAIFGAR